MGIENFKKVKSKEVVVANWSVKNKDGRILKKLRNSIFKHKQNNIFLARINENEKFEIFKGKEAFKILMEKDIEEVMIYDFGKITEIESKLIYLETSIKHSDNYIEVGELVKEISSELKQEDFERFINFNFQEMEDLINLANFDWNKYLKKEPTEIQTSLF